MFTAPLDRRRAKLTCISGLLTGEPLSVTFFRDRGLRRWVERRHDPGQTGNDLREFIQYGAVYPGFATHRQAGRRTGRCQFGKVPFLLRNRPACRCGKSTGASGGWCERLERRVALECDYSVLVSEAEAALFRTKVPEAACKIVGISNGVDHRYFDPSQDHAASVRSGRPVFVFTGTMDYLPNIDAVIWFATKVLPIIRRTMARGAVLYRWQQPGGCGKDASRSWMVSSSPGGCRMSGLISFMPPRRSAPMRIARGIQNKVLEAMAMGKTRHRHIRRTRGDRRDAGT